jgi:hypothetical protein
MVKQTTDIVHEQGVEQISDLFLVGKLQSALKGDPNSLQVHRANLHNMADLLALEDTVPTTSSHTSHVEQLGTVDHVVVLSAGNTDSLSFYLITQAPFVFPQGGGDSRLGTRGRQLSSGIIDEPLHRCSCGVAITRRCYCVAVDC